MKYLSRVLALWVLLLSVTISAAEKQYTREYRYDASELESRVTARRNAVRILKAELLEEISSYVFSENELVRSQKNSDFESHFKSKIKTISGGSIRSKVIDERWDGNNLWIKAILSVDPQQVKKDLDKLLASSASSGSQPVNPVAMIPVQNTAVPVYNVYVQLAKVSNVLSMIMPVKLRVIQYYQMNGEWPATLDMIGLDAASMTDGENIASVELNNKGEIRALLTGEFGHQKFISLNPREVMGGTNIKWDCQTNLSRKIFSVPGAFSCKSI